MSIEAHVAVWTPLVTWPIGTSSSGTSGQQPCQMCRATRPWSLETPKLKLATRKARIVVQNRSF